ncbi:hypothetical protein JXA48_03510 [Candidatus Woesearchaeota archaeon]|nr:hypothetical protein [Candidatus Woesearchaeota archaeon]
MVNLKKTVLLPLAALTLAFAKADVAKIDSLKSPSSLEQTVDFTKRHKFIRFSDNNFEGGFELSPFQDFGVNISFPILDIGELSSLYFDVSLSTPFNSLRPYFSHGVTARLEDFGIQAGLNYVADSNGAPLPPNKLSYDPAPYIGIKRFFPEEDASFFFRWNMSRNSYDPAFTTGISFAINRKRS